MKKTLTIFSLLAFSIFIFSNFSSTETTFIVTSLSEEPDLPEVPFDYGDLVVPDHVRTPNPAANAGYYSTGVPLNSTLDVENNRATLGRVLFYDQVISSMENLSCASCHIQERSFADDKAFSEGLSVPTKRNSIHLNDLFWSNKDHFFWSMSENDLAEMIKIPLKDENEIGANLDDIIVKMENTTYYPDLFQKAYNSSDISEDKIAEALEHFISSMVTFDSKFDVESPKGFTGFNDQELLGLDLFAANCVSCHNQGRHDPFGTLGFSNTPPLQQFPFIFNNGLESDPADLGAGEAAPGYEDLFKIPTIRNVELTAPYMHDGRFETLEEVMDHYSDGIVENQWSSQLSQLIPTEGFQFTEIEKQAMIAFMKTLTGRNVTTNEMWANPFSFVSNVENKELANVVVKPNPMQDFALIEFDNDAAKNVVMNIMTVDGRTVRTERTSGEQFRVEKDDFKAGMYLIELLQENNRTVKKLIVK